jgi:Flp pilus assembly protein TadD
MEEAIAQFRVAASLNPDYGPALASLAHALDATGRIGAEEARRDYERALALDHDQPETRCDLGLALLRLGKPAEAGSQFDLVLRDRPDFARAHYGRGVALALVGRRQEARFHLERALALDPGDAAADRALAGLDSLRGVAAPPR